MTPRSSYPFGFHVWRGCSDRVWSVGCTSHSTTLALTACAGEVRSRPQSVGEVTRYDLDGGLRPQVLDNGALAGTIRSAGTVLTRRATWWSATRTT
jgi:hypothetical protein